MQDMMDSMASQKRSMNADDLLRLQRFKDEFGNDTKHGRMEVASLAATQSHPTATPSYLEHCLNSPD